MRMAYQVGNAGQLHEQLDALSALRRPAAAEGRVPRPWHADDDPIRGDRVQQPDRVALDQRQGLAADQ
jgi:hypothetical protein